MRRNLIAAATAVIVLAGHTAHAQDAFYKRRTEGWHFYVDPAKEEPASPAPAPLPPQPMDPPGPEVLSSAWLRDNLPVFRDRAIDNPTPENVEVLAYLQRLAVDRSERFSQMWQRVVTSNPSLDETARSPISSFQQAAAREQVSIAKQEIMARISERAGIWYFYMSTCPYCARQEPVLERVARNFGLSILPISLDGGPPPTWRDVAFVSNDGHAQQLGVMVTPTLVVADTVTGELHNLAAGLRTDQEIEERLLEVAVMTGWITEDEYERARRGEPRRFISDGFASTQGLPEDPGVLLELLRNASINGTDGGNSTPWVVAPPSGDTQ